MIRKRGSYVASRYALAFDKAILGIEAQALPGERYTKPLNATDQAARSWYYIPVDKLHQQVASRHRVNMQRSITEKTHRPHARM